MSLREEFFKLFFEMDICSADKKRKKIEEMNEILVKMDDEEFDTVFTRDMFSSILGLLEKKKVSPDDIAVLLKHYGFCRELKSKFKLALQRSQLSKRFELLYVEEENKKQGKNEKLLIDLCECCLLLTEGCLAKETLAECVAHLLKVALKKDENEEIQKEVEMALLALSSISRLVV
ncbi:uncharacterized protein MONOS_16957 [Monocercomonoides exilis]|uniref:uncharacterized protein n=1 Tax=Monocercomonoides exilis TaxID=2049356 RepID=UPI00355A3496|nr:hypothetical protein MONOS_16957 [Monocercomonoides exilis]